MYSKAKVAGHPIHQILIPFPIAFITSAFASFSVYHFGIHDPFWYRVGYVATFAAIIASLVAAVPGLIDWGAGIPKNAPAKTVGLYHAALNTFALLLFGITAYVIRGTAEAPLENTLWPVLLTGLGFAATGAAGYLGGELVDHYKVGVALTKEQEQLEPTARHSQTTQKRSDEDFKRAHNL